MDVIHLVELLIYTFGVFAYGAFLVLGLRLPRRRRWFALRHEQAGSEPSIDRVGGALILVSFAWFVVLLLQTLASLSPRTPQGPLDLAFLVLAFLIPPVVMHCVYKMQRHVSRPATSGIATAGARPTPHPAWAWSVVAVYAVSQSMSLFTVLRILDVIDPAPSMLDEPGTWVGVLVMIAGLYSALAFSKSSVAAETSERRSSRRSMRGLFGLLALLFVPLILDSAGWIRLSEIVGELYQVVLRSFPLVFLVTTTYIGNRFTFFDVFVKRGLSLMLTIVVLTAYFAVLSPWLAGLEIGWAQPWVYALVLLPVALSLPWVYQRLGRWLDNFWLGRRFSTVEAVKHFLSSIQTATSEPQLVERAEAAISAIFHAPTQIDLRPQAESSPAGESAWELPIDVQHERVGVIRMGRRANKVPFFSEDAALLGSLADVFSYLLENMRLQEKKQEQEQLAKELSLHASQSDLKTLRAQINPHFLFNALNAIAGLIHKDPLQADRTVEQLAEVFRYTLRRSESEWVRLEDELAFVRAYLEVEQARFGRRLQFRIEADSSVERVRVPTMMVQTLVENAVKHGVAAVRGPGRIEIDARQHDDRLQVVVVDNGPGFTDEDDAGLQKRTGQSGYGLRNVRERLHGYFGDRATLVAERDQDRRVTRVSITMPLAPVGHVVSAGDPETSAAPAGDAR